MSTLAKIKQAARLDFHLVQQYLTLRYLALFVGMSIVLSFATGSAAFAIGMLMVYAILYVSYPFAVGDKANGDLLYATLPMDQKTMVRGRYLFSLQLLLAGGVLALGCGLAVSAVQEQGLSVFEAVVTSGICFLMFAVVGMLQLPLYFALPYAKAKIFSMLPLFLLPLVSFGVLALSKQTSAEEAIRAAFVLVTGNVLPSLLLILAALLLLAWGSMRLSLYLYQKREF